MYFLILILIIGLEIYAFQAFKVVFKKKYKLTLVIYISVTLLIYFYVMFVQTARYSLPRSMRQIGLLIFLANLISKFVICFWVFVDDARRLIILGKKRTKNKHVKSSTTKEKISRSQFLAKTGLVLGTTPVIATTYGALKGVHDFRVVHTKIPVSNLSSAFKGIKIGHISDIHVGSFVNKQAVKYGVEMLIKEKPDIIFFTGDLVNRNAREMEGWFNIFEKIKADLGVYAILGNHDYGHYRGWYDWSIPYKNKVINPVVQAHKQLGWNILLNENKIIAIDKEKLAIIGVENYSTLRRFPTFSNLAQAYKNTQDCGVKLLLSHDPSHWDDQICKDYKDIDVTFSGHTHGMQAGIEVFGFQFSPIQFLYKQWAGLYKNGTQHIYVNRGFGYNQGFPVRIGMPPEIGIVELVKA